MVKLRMIDVGWTTGADDAAAWFAQRCIPAAAFYVQSLRQRPVEVSPGCGFVRLSVSNEPLGGFDCPELLYPGLGEPMMLGFGVDRDHLPVADDAPLSEVAAWLHRPLRFVGDGLGWNPEGLDVAREYAVERADSGSIDTFRKRSPDHQWYAELAWSCDVSGAMSLGLSVIDRDGTVVAQRHPRIDAPALLQMQDWRQMCRELKWTSKRTVEVPDVMAVIARRIQLSVP